MGKKQSRHALSSRGINRVLMLFVFIGTFFDILAPLPPREEELKYNKIGTTKRKAVKSNKSKKLVVN